MTLKDSLRRTRKKRGGDDWVTIDDLGRNFNGDDFEVDQIIDIKLTATSDPIPNLIIIGIYDKKIVARQPGFEVYYSDIYSVKFPRKKPPKSAMKTGRKKTEKRRLDPKLPLGRAILGGRRKKRKTRRKPRRRRKTHRKKRRKRRKSRCRKKCKKHSRVHFFHEVGEAEAFEGKESCQHGGGDPQKDLHDAIKENHEVGAIQAIHNGAKVNQARDYTRPKPLEADSPEGRICTGETVMRKGKQTPLTHAIQENAMIGIAEHILGNRVGQEPGIDLDFKDPWYEPPKTAYEIAKDVNNTGAMERINDRRAADAGFGSGGGEKMDVDSETDKKNKFKF